MARKLAIKKLTQSDLTLFKWHFINRPAGNQKGFNLDARVLVRSLYPLLPEVVTTLPNQRVPLDLYFYGPGLAGAHNLQRKILKQEKNWRLNGEFVENPDDAPTRYNVLRSGDFALFEFSGTVIPNVTKVVLVASEVAEDATMFAELSRRYPTGSMFVVTEEELGQVVEGANPPEGHVLYDWVESDAIEDAAMGGERGIRRLNTRRQGRGLSPQDFQRSRQAAERVGLQGEVLLNEHFDELLERGLLQSFEWTSSVNAISPYDFALRTTEDQRRVVDAKSTAGDFSNPLHISLSELHRAVRGEEPYDIYRLYKVTDDSATLRIVRDVGAVLGPILAAATAMPQGVSIDSVSLTPDFLGFEREECLLEFPEDTAADE
jgi:Domain of unknown function (DUF3883)